MTVALWVGCALLLGLTFALGYVLGLTRGISHGAGERKQQELSLAIQAETIAQLEASLGAATAPPLDHAAAVSRLRLAADRDPARGDVLPAPDESGA